MNPVAPAFERQTTLLKLESIVSLRTVKAGRSGSKYRQILASIREVGLVEAPVVFPRPRSKGRFVLLDGHLRVAALKELGWTEVRCLIATEDDSFTYNRQINRLAPAQDYRMIAAAIKQGVPQSRLASALNMSKSVFLRRKTLMDGICPEARAMLADRELAQEVFLLLKRVKPLRQIEACELMEAQGNYTPAFVRAMVGATPTDQLVAKRPKALPDASIEKLVSLEKELASLRVQMGGVEDSYGRDVLRFTVIQAYLAELMRNDKVNAAIGSKHPSFHREFQKIISVSSLPDAAYADPAR